MRTLRKKEKGKRKKGRIGVISPVLSPWSAKRSTRLQGSLGRVMVVALALLLVPFAVHANERLESPNYILDPNVANSFGGLSESGSYSLVDSGGEAATGLGSSDSYKLSSGYISQLQQSIELNVLPSGLAAYYPFNTDTDIQAYDVTPNSNQGVLTNGPTWVDGKVGDAALTLDGASDYVKVPASSSLDTASVITMSAWIKPEGTAAQPILEYNNGTTFGVHLWQFDSFDELFINLRDTDGNSHAFSSSPDQFTAGNWHYVAVTYDGNTANLYVNGKNVGSRVFGAFTLQTGYDFYVGARASSSNRFNGTIDEVKVYDRALNADEIADEYNASNSGIASALTLPKISPGASQYVAADAAVITDAGGYDLSIEQTRDLTRVGGGETIPAISSSISNPGPWNEGGTKGLGFTVTGGTQVDPKWGTDPDYEYAAIPGSATTFHSRIGLTGGVKEVTGLQFRLGVDGAQTSGLYKNRVGFTATLKP